MEEDEKRLKARIRLQKDAMGEMIPSTSSVEIEDVSSPDPLRYGEFFSFNMEI